MAYTAHGILSPGVATSVSITPGEEGIVVVNRSLEGELWVRIDGTDPTLGGADSYVILGAREFPMSRAAVRRGTVNVRLISNAARTYSVEAIQA